MNNLELLVYEFIRRFPQKLGRTMLAKAIYLLDCEWYKSFGVTYSGLIYKRDNNGPFDTAMYDAVEKLEKSSWIAENIGPNGFGYQYEISQDTTDFQSEMNPIALNIMDEIVQTLSYKGLHEFLDQAYNTEPMLEILNEEDGQILRGRQLNMDKLKRSPEPLFNFDEIREVAKTLNMTNRGSDEEYNKTILKEMNELEIYRERVSKVCQAIEE